MMVNISLFPTLKGYKKEYLSKDIFAGIIIAAMSIPWCGCRTGSDSGQSSGYNEHPLNFKYN